MNSVIYSQITVNPFLPIQKGFLFATHDELTQNCKRFYMKKKKSNKYSQTFLPHQQVTMDVRELRSVAMSIILKQRVCRTMMSKPSSLHNKQGFQTYPPVSRSRRQTQQYKEIDVSVFDALFEGKPIEGIPDISSPKSTPTFTFNEKRSRYRHVKDRDFFLNCKKSVSQLILYWETVWLVGKESAGRCAGWNW
ncbi:hypothetical protein RclHR1_04400008 [Rhizophagus clarus]|uniref:Uncharacterized protein n=1 Tax=Rhizophagus clarus TaxID=94130 RepID=A0A2Z6RUM3_9GLOM|nr:hypothetical protein RclHR1_04400008 [Rhizophagus clarus]